MDSLDQSLLTACRKHLAEAAERVFDRYQEAPERAGTDLAEKFLRAPNLRAITSQIDPLGLVQVSGGNPTIKTDHKGLVSIKDYVERNGTVEGKKLLDVFSGPPFGWSPDTVRYMVAALLVAGEVKLKVSGREVTVTGQQAIEALKTNNTFKSVGVALRDDRPSMEVLARATERLTDLSGEPVVPLEEDIGKAAQKLLPSLQHQLAPLAERLQTLGLPGVETVRSANQQIADMLLSDASDAPQRFGSEQSPLYDGLKWAIAAKLGFDQGIAETVKALRDLERGIDELPGTGVPKDLRDAVREDLDTVADMLAQEDFSNAKPISAHAGRPSRGRWRRRSWACGPRRQQGSWPPRANCRCSRNGLNSPPKNRREHYQKFRRWRPKPRPTWPASSDWCHASST